jgi:choline dehydrogenase-like flavoprotein
VRGELVPGPDVNSDAESDTLLRASASSVHHPVGTCAIGDDAAAVVDQEPRVQRGGRASDASVMPSVLGADINATAIATVEKTADLVTVRSVLDHTSDDVTKPPALKGPRR